jgi:acyl-CoA synthetase (AMP-forming)/AMP-acid ligase II
MNIGQGLAAAAWNGPDRTAALDDGVSLTYSELVRRTEALAGALRRPAWYPETGSAC